jgi:selenium-dependent xanthine dehydrogenase
MPEITFTLNGAPFTARADESMSLMEVLREQAGLISPKNGCAPQGSCGSCTVLVDGRALSSCVVLALQAAGSHVLTLDGFDARERHVFAHAFGVTGGVQCGFCIPGIVVAAKHLIDANPAPTRQQIAEALNNHICRCTGYVKIIDAIELAAEVLRGGAMPPADYSGRIGTSLPRQDAERFVLGERPYVDDMKVDGMLFGAFLFSEHARARVLRIDPGQALEAPGVVRVLTAADVPGERYQGLIERDWPLFVAEGETTHCIGDILAAAVADTDRHARQAVARIRIDYELLPGVFSPDAALAPGAPRVHPDRDNLLSRSSIVRGDVDAALAASPLVETRTFTTQLIEHAFLEPEACLAIPTRDSGAVVQGSDPESRVPNPVIELFSQGQGVFDDRRQIASFLGLAESDVHVTLVSNGGAFGGKEDLSIQGQVALMALAAGRPVKATLARHESIRLHPKRHPMTLTYTVGCDRSGCLTGLRARIVGDKGAFASVGAKVLERAAGHAAGPYRVPAVDIESLAVYTNNLPCGAMRGFGANQAAFAIESMLDILAERVGIDSWEIRWRNALEVGDTFCTGQVLESAVGLKDTLLAVKGVYYGSKRAGIACGVKNVGIGNGMPEAGQVVVDVTGDGHVVIHTGFTEMGQGFYTTMAQCLCDITGIDARLVRTEVDTSHPTPCGMTTASRATVLGGRAVQEAARRLKADLGPHVLLMDLAGRRYYGEHRADETVPLGADVDRPRTHLTYGFATQVCVLDARGRVASFVAAHDVGRVINRHLVEGQIEGAVHMGLGYALTEELRLSDGVPESFKLRSLGLIRARDMPEVTVVLIESCDPEGPFGAKGVGEIGLVPTAGAVANALYRFDGVRRYALPMRDSPAARAMIGGRDSGIGIRPFDGLRAAPSTIEGRDSGTRTTDGGGE